MATVVGYAYARIDQEGKKWYDDDSKPNTCFGLPGSGGRRASYSAVNMDAHVAVLDDGNVHIGFNGGISSSWKACNRRMSGAWATRLNDERSAASDNEVLRRVSGAWARSGKF